MPAKKKKDAVVETAPAPVPAAKPESVEVPAAPSQGGDSKRMAERLKEALRMHRDLKRTQAEVKEAKAKIERSEAQAQELKKTLKDAEKALLSDFPESAGVLDFVLVEDEAEDEKKVKTPRTRRSKGAKLSSEQVDRLLDGLTEPFTAEEFSKKADTMFPGLANKPIMKIAAGKVQKVPGKSGRWTEYTRIKG